MAVAFGALGVLSAGVTATPVAPAYPASVGAGNLVLACRVGWLSNINLDALAGWTFANSQEGGINSAADDHTTECRVDYREAAGGETGTVNFAISGTISGAVAEMIRYTKGSDPWDVVSSIGTDNTHAANRSVTGSPAINIIPGDVVVAFVAVDTDAALTITVPAITATSITFGTTTRRTTGVAGVTSGVDGNIEIFDATATVGAANSAPVLNFTTATSQCGPVVFVRLREVTAAGGVVPFLVTPTRGAPPGGARD